MAKLTIIELKAITPANIGMSLRDDGGLWGRVRQNRRSKSGVSVTFWYRFKWEGKTKDVACGTWPSNTMPEIRQKRDDARNLVSNGTNPADQKKIVRQEQHEAVAEKLAKIECQKNDSLTVNELFSAWLADGVRRKDGNHELRRSFNANILPQIGSKPVKAVNEHDLLDILRGLANRGVDRTAVVMRNNLMQMFAWAEKRQPWRKLLIDGNPVNLIEIEKIVSHDYDMKNERDRTLSSDEICELRDKFETISKEFSTAPNKRTVPRPVAQTTELAIWLMLSTMCRVGELSMSRWEHVNFDTREWFVPKENVKDNLADLKVFLSDFALYQFRQLYQVTKHSEWCFPATNKEGHVCVKSISKQVGDRQIMFKKDRAGGPRKPMKNRSKDGNALVLANGKNGAWTPHDLRRTSATLMQSVGVPLEIIDRCQNHVLPGSKTRRHYLHHDYAAEKRDAWEKLGDRLSLILNKSDNVTLIKSA